MEGVPNVYGKAFDQANHAARTHGATSTAAYLFCSSFLPWPFGGEHGGLARALYDWLSPEYRRMKQATKARFASESKLARSVGGECGSHALGEEMPGGSQDGRVLE